MTAAERNCYLAPHKDIALVVEGKSGLLDESTGRE